MSSPDERRRARAAWPIRRFRLGDEPLVDDRDTSTVDERLALVWTLTREQWAAAGLPYPTYERSQMPTKVFRREG